MKRFRLGIIGGAIALAAVGVALAHPGHPPIVPPKVSFAAQADAIPFDLFRGQRIILTGLIDSKPTEMMLDSGAGSTLIDQAYADSIGIKSTSAPFTVRGATGDAPARMATGVTVEVGGLRLTDLTVVILDMAPIERAIGRKIPVVLGREAFKASAVTIDFPKRLLRFTEPSRFTPPAAATRLQLDDRGLVYTVKLELAGLPPIEADLDLGNGGTVMVSQSYWKSQPALAAIPYARGLAGGIGGLKPTRRVTLPSVTFAGSQFSSVPATLNEDATMLPVQGANVGTALLRSFVVTVYATGKSIYLERAGPSSFDKERAGLLVDFLGDRLKAVFVSPESPAAAAGLRAGDEIVAVDGRPVDSSYYKRPDWTRGDAGRMVSLNLANGKQLKVALADYY